MHLADYLSQKVWSPLGMQSDASWWLDSPNGHEVGGSGVLATLRDFGRFGQFILKGAQIDGKKIVPDGWLAVATRTMPLVGVSSPTAMLTNGGPLRLRLAASMKGYSWDGAFTGNTFI
ncbi:MAG: hypothetical protein ABIP64_12510 [Burkholderiales bacterium]